MNKRIRRKYKILLFSASFPPPAAGGSIEYIFNIFSKLSPGCAVIYTSGIGAIEEKKIDQSFPQKVVRKSFIVHVLNRKLNTKIQNFLRIFQWVHNSTYAILLERPDIVHIGEYNYSFISALLIKKIFNTPYIIYTYAEEITNLENKPIRLWIFKQAVQNASCIIAVSEYTKNLIINCGVVPSKIVKLLPAIGELKRKIPSLEEIKRVRKKYNILNEKIILTVGRIEERKGHQSVIEALPRILISIPNALYIIAGTGAFEGQVREKVLASKLTKNVLFVGRVSDEEIAALYEICNVFIMPHRQLNRAQDTEGCPTVFLEASAHGKPVIGGNAGGVADAILDGITGFIIDGTNKEQIAFKVIEILQNIELSKRFGENGLKYTNRLTPDKSAEFIDKLNISIIDQR